MYGLTADQMKPLPPHKDGVKGLARIDPSVNGALALMKVDPSACSVTEKDVAKLTRRDMTRKSGVDESEAMAVICDKPQRHIDAMKSLANKGKILRFKGIFVSESCSTEDDKVGELIVDFYVTDDEIQIFEPSRRNSGIISGEFLEKSAHMNPHTAEQFRECDFFVGASIKCYSREFLLTAADEFT